MRFIAAISVGESVISTGALCPEKSRSADSLANDSTRFRASARTHPPPLHKRIPHIQRHQKNIRRPHRDRQPQQRPRPHSRIKPTVAFPTRDTAHKNKTRQPTSLPRTVHSKTLSHTPTAGVASPNNNATLDRHARPISQTLRRQIQHRRSHRHRHRAGQQRHLHQAAERHIPAPAHTMAQPAATCRSRICCIPPHRAQAMLLVPKNVHIWSVATSPRFTKLSVTANMDSPSDDVMRPENESKYTPNNSSPSTSAIALSGETCFLWTNALTPFQFYTLATRSNTRIYCSATWSP